MLYCFIPCIIQARASTLPSSGYYSSNYDYCSTSKFSRPLPKTPNSPLPLRPDEQPLSSSASSSPSHLSSRLSPSFYHKRTLPQVPSQSPQLLHNRILPPVPPHTSPVIERALLPVPSHSSSLPPSPQPPHHESIVPSNPPGLTSDQFHDVLPPRPPYRPYSPSNVGSRQQSIPQAPKEAKTSISARPPAPPPKTSSPLGSLEDFHLEDAVS